MIRTLVGAAFCVAPPITVDWGDATTATPEMGERYLALGVKSTLAVLANIEKTFAAMPPR